MSETETFKPTHYMVSEAALKELLVFAIHNDMCGCCDNVSNEVMTEIDNHAKALECGYIVFGYQHDETTNYE